MSSSVRQKKRPRLSTCPAKPQAVEDEERKLRNMIDDGDDRHESAEGGTKFVENPVLNPVILKRFFEICELGDIRRFRQVCTLWHDLSLSRWRKEAKIVLTSEKYENYRYMEYLPGTSPPQRKRLTTNTISTLYDNESGEEFKYKSYYLHTWKFKNPILGYLRGNLPPRDEVSEESIPLYDMAMFWRNCGHWIHHLELSALTIEYIRPFHKVIFEMTPNLRSLQLTRLLTMCLPFSIMLDKLLGDEEEEEEEQVVNVNYNLKMLKLNEFFSLSRPYSWKQLFVHFPNLEELYISGGYRDDSLKSLVTDFEELCSRTKGKKLAIKCIRFDYMFHRPPPDVIKRIFNQDKLQLERLYFSKFHDPDLTIVPNIIQRNSKTLKEIHIRQFPGLNQIGLDDQFPELSYPSSMFKVGLPNLTVLELDSIITEDLDFLRFTPNVKSLCIHATHRGTHGFANDGMITTATLKNLKGLVLDKLEELQVLPESAQNTLLPGGVAILGKCFPNVEKLHLPITLRAFPVLCQMWTKLRTLSIDGDQIDDEIFTGIPTEAGSSSGSKARPTPNITDLKDLRSLSVKSKILSDPAIYEGFLQLPALTRLAVKMSTKTSDEAFKALCARFPSFLIRRDRETVEGELAEKSQMQTELSLKADKYFIDYGIY